MAKRSVSRREAASTSQRSPSPTWLADGGMKGSWTPVGARMKGRREMGGKSIAPSSSAGFATLPARSIHLIAFPRLQSLLLVALRRSLGVSGPRLLPWVVISLAHTALDTWIQGYSLSGGPRVHLHPFATAPAAALHPFAGAVQPGWGRPQSGAHPLARQPTLTASATSRSDRGGWLVDGRVDRNVPHGLPRGARDRLSTRSGCATAAPAQSERRLLLRSLPLLAASCK